MKLNLQPYDSEGSSRARCIAALAILTMEAKVELAAEIAAVEPPKAATVKCRRDDCATRFVNVMDRKAYCSSKCMTVMKVRRFRSREAEAMRGN